ncbi:MAG: hypothetical protein PHS79_05845 [Patescibacteria group bacterium]|nr:hypothetical protein [Patescibacteria group bacterium]
MSEADQKTYEFLLNMKMLKRVLPANMPMEEGGIFVTCSDGDQFDDAYQHLAGCCLTHRAWPRICPPNRMGGAIVIPKNSKIREMRGNAYGDDLITDILALSRIKKTPFVTLFAHAPCAMAKEAGLSLAEELYLLALAKKELKQADAALTEKELGQDNAEGNIKVACFVHIQRLDGLRKTYFFPVGQWQLITSRYPVIHGEQWPPHLSDTVAIDDNSAA